MAYTFNFGTNNKLNYFVQSGNSSGIKLENKELSTQYQYRFSGSNHQMPTEVLALGLFMFNFATLFNDLQPDTYSNKLVILQNGNYTKAYRYPNGGRAVRYFYADDTPLIYGGSNVEQFTSSSQTGSGEFFEYHGITFGWFNNVFGPARVDITDTSWGNTSLSVTPMKGFDSDTLVNIYLNWLNNQYEEAPLFSWSQWDCLRGNNGQFRAYLTKLKTQNIPNDPSVYSDFNTTDFDVISNESSIWNAFLNSSLDVERTVAWSGRCKLTLTVSDYVSDSALKVFTFKFYIPDASIPFYTYSQDIPISSSTPSNNYRDYFLSFLYDDNEECAAFYPFGFVPQSVKQIHTLGYRTITRSEMNTLWQWLHATDAGEGDPDNPYDTGTEDTGGNPNGYDGHQDSIVNITPPSLDGTSSGMFTIYCPDDTELTQIAAFLWSDNVIDNFKKYFNNFSDNIIAFYVLPYKPQNLPTKAFKVGRVTSDTITSVEYVTNRFVTIDMGELVVDDKWDSYLDFGPYTKFNIYLPGIGVQALDADDIMCPANQDGSMPSELGSTIKLEYNMDLMTGIVVCFVKINGQVRYQFSGKIGYQIPLTGETHRTLMQGFAMATAGLIGTVATGGAAAPFAAAAASAAIINAMKPDVYRGGNLSGDAASLCYKTPYLIRRMPNKPMLVDQQKFTGYQSYKTGLLSEFSGYTECEDAHVEGISCTEEERELIMDWLRKGVIL